MASFTGVGDNVVLSFTRPGEAMDVAISGTYDMVIELQEEVTVGGGAWRKVKQFDTANATEAYTHYSSGPGKSSFRLIVTTDDGGTATATLTSTSDVEINEIQDAAGNVVMTYKESGVLVGPSGSQCYLPRAPVTITAADSITAEEHANRLIILDNAAGFAVTLPAATGTGNVYKFLVGTTVTSVSMDINCAGSDKMAGMLQLEADAGTEIAQFANAGTAVSVDMNGTTEGGVKGTLITCVDAASALWSVTGFVINTAVTPVTPFQTS